MDEDLQALEAELTRLRPAAPSAALEPRLRGELAPRTAPRRTWWLAAGALPIAAAVAALIALKLRFTESPATPAATPTAMTATTPATKPDAAGVLKPVSAENVLYAASEDGVVTLDDGTVARRQRLQFVDTITWQNPRTHASLTWSVPREEVRIVPISYQ